MAKKKPSTSSDWIAEAKAECDKPNARSWISKLAAEQKAEIREAAIEGQKIGVPRKILANVIHRRLGLTVTVDAVCRVLRELEIDKCQD